MSTECGSVRGVEQKLRDREDLKQYEVRKFRERFVRAKKEWEAINDPDFLIKDYSYIERKYKLRKGRAKQMGRILGIKKRKPGKWVKLIELHKSGEIDLAEMSYPEITEATGIGKWGICEARKALEIKKESGWHKKEDFVASETSILMSGWGR